MRPADGGRVLGRGPTTKVTPWLLLSPALATLAGLLIAPLAFVAVYSFWLNTGAGADRAGLHLDNWQRVLADPLYWTVLGRTLRVAAIVALLCAAIGVLPAYWLAMTRLRRRWLLVLLLMLPFWISYIIRTMAWIPVLGTNGLVNQALMAVGLADAPVRLLYDQTAVVLGLVHYLLPFMIVCLFVTMDAIDRRWIDAARSLGASGWQAFRRVTLPLALPGLAAGTVLCFVLAAGAYITPLILGGPGDMMIANLIYGAMITQLDWPLGAALSLLLLVLLGSVLAVGGRILTATLVASAR